MVEIAAKSVQRLWSYPKHVGGFTLLLALSVAVSLAISGGAAHAQTTCNAANEAQVNACIATYNDLTSGGLSIEMSADIVLTDDLAIIANTTEPAPTLFINGNGHALDGNNNGNVANIVRMTDGSLRITDVTVKDSVGDGAEFQGGDIRIIGSTFSGHDNRGIFASSSEGVVIENSTVAFNLNAGVEVGVGDSVEITLSTIARNGTISSPSFGIKNGSGTVTLTDSVVRNFFNNCESTVVNGGGNAVQDSSCTGSRVSVSLANALADNGCVTPCTQTLALLPGSAAIDRAGSCTEFLDQRSMPRTSGLCDSGAFEAGDCTEMIDVSSAYEMSIAAGCYTNYTGDGMTINVVNDIETDSTYGIATFDSDARAPVTVNGNGHTSGQATVVREARVTVRNIIVANTTGAFRVLPEFSGQLVLEESTLRDNSTGVSASGAGDFASVSVQITNSTLYNNITGLSVSSDGLITATGVTIVDSDTGARVSGVDSFIWLRHSLVARSAISDCAGTDLFTDMSIYSDTSCDGVATPDLDASLAGTLAANGCPGCAPTIAVLAGSPAIDAGGDCGLATDQRGAIRPAGKCDAGAFEAATCQGHVVTIDMNLNGGNGTGTVGDDVILGTPGGDVIDGKEGSDIICGEGGNDQINGGAGDFRDFIDGGIGNDTLFGGFGVDTLWGGPGADTLDGGGGSDRLFGQGDDDLVLGDSGADRMFGGPGDDELRGMGGQDMMWGGSGDDLMQGNFQTDNLFGGPGNDVMFGAGGKDSLFGEDGNDELSGGNNTDYLNGGSGTDIANGGRGRDKPLVEPDMRPNGRFVNGSGCIAETILNCQPTP